MSRPKKRIERIFEPSRKLGGKEARGVHYWEAGVQNARILRYREEGKGLSLKF